MANPIPEQVSDKILAFLRDAKTGSVTLDISQGRILACKITESIHIDKKTVKALN